MINYMEIGRLYLVWQSMMSRCHSPGTVAFTHYGARGIVVQPEWHDFNVFCAWALEQGSRENLQLDRTDNDGPYGPDNCRFVSRSENMRNTRRSRRLIAFGETKTLVGWSEDPRCAVGMASLKRRLNDGWDDERAISSPQQAGRRRRKASA